MHGTYVTKFGRALPRPPSAGRTIMTAVSVLVSILTGLSLGRRLSARPVLPVAGTIGVLAYTLAPTLPDAAYSGLPEATLCVALLNVTTLIGLAWRLRAEDHRQTANHGR
jgi:hypothetical protein